MQIEHRFAVPPRSLFATLVDPAFLSARSDRYGEVGTLRLEHDGDQTVIVTQWQLPVRRVPAHVRRYVSDGRIVQIERWPESGGESVTGSVEVDAGRMPVVISARQQVAPAEPGCCYRVDLRVDVAVPLLGRVLRRELYGHLAQLIGTELGFLDEWVSAVPEAV